MKSKRLISFLLTSFTLCFASPTRIPAAEIQNETTIQGLYDRCQNARAETVEDAIPSSMDQGFCLGYLLGIATAQFAVGQVITDMKLRDADYAKLRVFAICDTGGFNSAQLKQLFLNWAQANPTFWRKPAAVGAFTTFNRAWPCPLRSAQ